MRKRAWADLKLRSYDIVSHPRLLTRAAAAAYCGLRPSTFDDWVRRELLPTALPMTRRWDLKAIDAALDRLSGLNQKSNNIVSAFDSWKLSS